MEPETRLALESLAASAQAAADGSTPLFQSESEYERLRAELRAFNAGRATCVRLAGQTFDAAPPDGPTLEGPTGIRSRHGIGT
jgi:hypothetical protein